MMSVKAHHLRGSFRVFACHEAQEAAMRLETLDGDANAQPVFEKLKIEYARVIDALNQVSQGNEKDSHSTDS